MSFLTSFFCHSKVMETFSAWKICGESWGISLLSLLKKRMLHRHKSFVHHSPDMVEYLQVLIHQKKAITSVRWLLMAGPGVKAWSWIGGLFRDTLEWVGPLVV